jgi:16S rRNA A1518/A1519 N6-dimethyltransferase RsmA/KsgA/DIM1 with predicted DNA glycosylase/AP lyase activity
VDGGAEGRYRFRALAQFRCRRRTLLQPNLEAGQPAAIDAALSPEPIAEAARCLRLEADSILDIGWGAGNYTLKLLAVSAVYAP